jgi:hypothetical protein
LKQNVFLLFSHRFFENLFVIGVSRSIQPLFTAGYFSRSSKKLLYIIEPWLSP